MSRYTNTIIMTRSPEEAAKMAADYLTSEGFKQKTSGDETLWQKGSGILTGPQFIRLSSSVNNTEIVEASDLETNSEVDIRSVNNTVIVEAWIKFAVLPLVYVGELGLDGFVGAVPKSVLKGRVKKLEEILAN